MRRRIPPRSAHPPSNCIAHKGHRTQNRQLQNVLYLSTASLAITFAQCCATQTSCHRLFWHKRQRQGALSLYVCTTPIAVTMLQEACSAYSCLCSPLPAVTITQQQETLMFEIERTS